MLRSICFALSLIAGGASAQELTLSNMLEKTGLAGTESRLTKDDPATRFALGGVRFLRGIERSLQLRYRHGATLEGMLDLPVLRLPVAANPQPEPFYPGLIADIFRGVTDDMALAREALASVEGDFGVTVDLAAIWFDVNESGSRDPGESLFEALGVATGVDAPPSVTVRFDTADAAWLRAYTHLLAGFGNLVLAFDPTPVVEKVFASTAQMQELRGDSSPRALFFSPQDEEIIELIAMIYGALQQQPNAEHTRAARDHWLAMVSENRAFWAAVAQESDNADEWIPNATQTAALGFDLPPETGATWMGVLGDAEAVLQGELLIAHPRVSPGAGVNLAKLMQDPVPVDIIGWVHGRALVDYMERGTLVGPQSLRRFEQMVGGDAVLFMVLLN